MARSDRVELPAVPASVALARQFIAAAFDGSECPHLTIDTALLIVSELATNAVVHARTPFTVVFTHTDDEVTIHVSDRSPAPPTPRPADLDGGRGLQIVAALATEWAVHTEAGGKSVTFRLPC